MTKTRWKLVAAASGAALLSIAAAPRAARAYRSWTAARRQARIAQAWASVKAGQDYLTFNPAAEDDGREEPSNRLVPEQDDPMLRGLANAAEWGYRSGAFLMQKLQVTAAEARKWAHLMPQTSTSRGASAPLSPAQLPAWVGLGPTDTAKKEYNGDEYVANDTGRIATIRVDPLDPNTVYVAENGGGIWRTSNFNITTPTWTPLTDTLGEMGMGSMDLFPGVDSAHHTLWAGLGDINEGTPGGVVFWSRDSGTTWNGPILLSGTYPSDPQPSTVATRVRDIKVDPNNPDIVMAATDVGFFRSINGTATTPTFALMDLPNAGANPLKESTWSIAFLGATSGGPSNWLVSGVYACAPTSGSTAYLNMPPAAGGGSMNTNTITAVPNPVGVSINACVGGNLGDIWKSTDGGATWTSARATGTNLLQPVITGLSTLAVDIGRIALAAGTPVAGDPTQTTVWAQASSIYEGSSGSFTPYGGNRNAAIFKTADSGTTYVRKAKSNDVASLTNPTFNNADCNNMNIAHGQSWYNLAIAVDPTNNSNAIVGGNLCSVRTIDGGTTWQAVSDWLPLPSFFAFGISQGNTDSGGTTYLPYVHADWHALTIANGIVIAGSDGGIFSAGATAGDPTSVFTTSTIDATHMPVTWRQVNTGLVTHLFYSVASGDPVVGNQRFAFGGLQDNGTRFRNSGTDTRWNQVVGGDGVGAAISIHPDGSKQVFFQSLPGRREFCRQGESFFIPSSFDPAIQIDCNSGLLHPNQGPDNLNTEFTTWNSAINPNLPNGDSEPFLQRYAATYDANGSLFTISSQYAWKLNVDDVDNVTYTLISNIFANRTSSPPAAVRSPRGMIFATPWTYNIGFPEPQRLYGVPLSGGWFYVGVENSFDPNNGILQPWSWTSSQSIIGSLGASGPLQQMTSTSSIAFPHNPTHLGGAAPGIPTDLLNTYIVSSVTPLDTANQLIRDDVGRIFKTTNNGTAWTSIAPVSSGMPNIPVNIVRFDPGDTTDQTIWAGTDIGVYRTTNGGTTWQRYGFGMPMVRITDMSFARNGSLLRVSTYGRGMWEIYPHAQAGTANGTGDWDGNGAVDFLDLAAMASRLGTTPADGSNRYEFTIDTNNDGTIDETDLTVLLAKYGSTP